MGMLDHWQPVTRSRVLRQKPLGVVVAGHPLVVFRGASGAVAAMSDACPHRRLKLSVGEVVGDRIRCKYHGWTFNSCGNGESPSSPKMSTCITSYDVREEHGLVWVKSRASNPTFPTVEALGYYPLGSLNTPSLLPWNWRSITSTRSNTAGPSTTPLATI